MKKIIVRNRGHRSESKPFKGYIIIKKIDMADHL